MVHRCQVGYLWAGISPKFHLKGNTEIIPIQSVQPLKKRGKVVTIVRWSFHQSASVITCQKKRKESPANDPEALETSPDI